MVQEDHDGRRTVTSIMSTLVTEHGMTGVSYPVVRGYVASLRGSRSRPRPAARDTVLILVVRTDRVCSRVVLSQDSLPGATL